MQFFSKLISNAAYKRNSGVVLVLMAICFTVLVLLVGIAIDTAKVLFTAHQLQVAADAASLAGACFVKTDATFARQQALDTAVRNFAYGQSVQLRLNTDNNADGDIVIGHYDRNLRTFVPNLTAVNAVKVVARRTSDSLGGPLPLSFGPIVGVQNSDVARSAIAIASGGTGAGLIALNPHGIGLEIQGDVTVDVNNGAIQVNSDGSNAVTMIGNSYSLEATELNVNGNLTGKYQTPPNPSLHTNAPPIPDPLAGVPEPTVPTPPNGQSITTSGTYNPGYYSGGIDIVSNTNVILKPGIYILGGKGLVIGGNASLNAQGVMFFVTGDTSTVDISGTGTVIANPLKYDADPNYFYDPTWSYPSGTNFTNYEGITIFIDRENIKNVNLQGNSGLNLTGTLYFPSNNVSLGGTPGSMGNQLICGSLYIYGNGTININYDGRNQAPGNKSFLVE